jgi:hypothetical protein
MKARLIRKKAGGQSIALIALMIVVLFAMVGLAVDVGNTYAEQRNTVRATDAASIAGMNALINGSDDATVYSVIVQSLSSNNIQVAEQGTQPEQGERVLEANYLDSSGNPIASCPYIGSCGSTVPQGVTYLRVNVGGKVDTFFARLVGQNTLPVGANAFAAKGACTQGVYPIAVRDTFLNENGFVNPDKMYSDNIYRNKTVKRIQMHDPNNNPNGGFDWLQWKAGNQAGSSTEMTAMLTGPGNISEGLDEVTPWPSASSLPQPAGYPIDPNHLNAGDWISGNSGVGNSSAVGAQLDQHIRDRTVMILPIWDSNLGSGQNAIYHISRLGAFLLTSYHLSGNFNGSDPNKQGYFELVYLGDASECATLVPPTVNKVNLGIVGQVNFRPRYYEVPKSRPPVQYEIILDVSGSMTWTFDGYGWKDGKKTLCTGANAGCNGTDNYWRDQTQRRIYIAKQAIKAFIDQMQPNDKMRLVTFSGDLGKSGPFGDQRAVDKLTHALPALDWSSDAAVLKDAVDDAGAQGGDPYKTEGRTPSAAGIAGGNQVLAAAPDQAPDGQTYKRVVIFLTDGVANIFRDGSLPGYTGNCAGATEVASCNVGTLNGKPLPITAMGLEADSLKQLAQIYVIALAGVDETGLKDVASGPNPPFFSSAKNGADLNGIFSSIATNVKYGTCVPAGGNSWLNTIDDSQAGDVAPPQGPLTFPVVGTAYLYDQNGNVLPNGKGQAPIMVDSQSGKLIYRFNDLTPGAYKIRAFVSYKGKDGESRIYDQLYNPNTATADTALSFQLAPSNALGTVVAMSQVYLDMSGAVCP